MVRPTILFLLPLIICVTAQDIRGRRPHGPIARGRVPARTAKPPVVITKPHVVITTKAPVTPPVVITAAPTVAAPIPLQPEKEGDEPEAEPVDVSKLDEEIPAQPESLPSAVPELDVIPIDVTPEVSAPVTYTEKAITNKPYIYTPKYTTPAQYVTKSPAIIPPVKTEPFKVDFICEEAYGYFAVEHECDSYYLCKHKVATKLWCPDGLHFNPNAKHHDYPCAYPSEAQCIAGSETQEAKPTDECPRQYGYFPSNDGDCSKYISCQEGAATYLSCPAGLVFNPILQGCDYIQNVPQCHSNVFKDFTCPEPLLDENGFVSDAIYNYKYGQECKEYIACQKGYPRLLSCEQGLAFDENSQSCVIEDYVEGCAV